MGFVEKCIDCLIDLGCEVKLESKAEGSVKDPVEYIKYDFSLSRNEEGLALMKEVIALAMVEDYTAMIFLKIICKMKIKMQTGWKNSLNSLNLLENRIGLCISFNHND